MYSKAAHFQSPTFRRPKTPIPLVFLLDPAHNFFISTRLKVNGPPVRPISSYSSPKEFPVLTPINSRTLYNPKKILSIQTPTNSRTPKATLSDSTAFLDTIDWSFLHSPSISSNEKMSSVVGAAQMEQGSRVMVCMGSQQFVDHLCSATPSIALSVLHYSLLELADIKERDDGIKCRQGDIVGIPPSWAPLDVVFINYLPALTCPLPQMFQTLVKCCKPGARVIINDIQGRAQLNKHKKNYPDVITGDLPNKVEMEKLLQGHHLQLVSFRDEPDFYLAVLKIFEGENS